MTQPADRQWDGPDMLAHLKINKLITLLLLIVMTLIFSGSADAGQNGSSVTFGPVTLPDFDVPNYALAADGDAIYLAGPASSDMAASKGAYDSTYNGGKSDIFIAKIDSRSLVPVAVTFLGGEGDESVRAIMVDHYGTLVLTGSTSSVNFASLQDRPFRDEEAVFVARIDTTLKRLVGVNFLGPGRGLDLARSSNGNMYLLGQTMSGNFPSASGGWDTTYNGGRADVFVARLASSLNVLRLTFLGGSGWELAQALTIMRTGEVAVAGFTVSPDFPVTGNPFKASPEDSGGNGFITRFDPELNRMVGSVLLGGSGHDVINSLTQGKGESLYVSGYTSSSDFPVTSGAYDRSLNGEADIFVTHLSGSLNKLHESTLIGGQSRDWAYDMVFKEGDGLYIAGDTDSNDFPGLNNNARYGRGEDASDIVFFKLNKDLNKVDDVIFSGGVVNERVPAMAAGPDNMKLFSGFTNSPGFLPEAHGSEKPGDKGYRLFVKRLGPHTVLPTVSVVP